MPDSESLYHCLRYHPEVSSKYQFQPRLCAQNASWSLNTVWGGVNKDDGEKGERFGKRNISVWHPSSRIFVTTKTAKVRFWPRLEPFSGKSIKLFPFRSEAVSHDREGLGEEEEREGDGPRLARVAHQHRHHRPVMLPPPHLSVQNPIFYSFMSPK